MHFIFCFTAADVKGWVNLNYKLLLYNAWDSWEPFVASPALLILQKQQIWLYLKIEQAYIPAGRNLLWLNISAVFLIDNVFTHSWRSMVFAVPPVSLSKQTFQRGFHNVSSDDGSAAEENFLSSCTSVWVWNLHFLTPTNTLVEEKFIK